ncbi:MAG: hypothetical protein RR816_07505, partial [Clostridia bacterium]
MSDEGGELVLQSSFGNNHFKFFQITFVENALQRTACRLMELCFDVLQEKAEKERIVLMRYECVYLLVKRYI